MRQPSYREGTRALYEAKLVVLHDELEAELGKIRVRQGGSAKGHNGLKSVATHLQGGMNGFVRIGVGIGRPQSRDPDVVSDYVLRGMTEREIEKVRAAAPAVAKELLKICGDPDEKEALEEERRIRRTLDPEKREKGGRTGNLETVGLEK